ncbi:hypothetical protein [Exiguobacterium artemiae]|uniref:hypothetical protein n=1 Tax=Exiguobacterium artemiae TaxID=340145 RepID=UPI00296425B3|nr:hypothetical protein [Exiguobacterium sibiricum]MDW2884438.1 hypothetical protein [Exiguobacterium sibiricum]
MIRRKDGLFLNEQTSGLQLKLTKRTVGSRNLGNPSVRLLFLRQDVPTPLKKVTAPDTAGSGHFSYADERIIRTV